MVRMGLAAASVAMAFALAPTARAETPAARVDVLAERFVDQALAYDRTLAYEAGLPAAVQDRFPDQAAAIEAYARAERGDLQALFRLDRAALPPAAMPIYAALCEKFESDLQLRVGRPELWDVNHFDGAAKGGS